MPNLDNIKIWHDDLLSGRFDQTTGYLSDTWGYCCLGVACESAREHGVPLVVDQTGARGEIRTYDSVEGTLPRAVAEWLGLDTDPSLVIHHDDAGVEYLTCTQANDDEGLSFAEIARLIRRTWPTAFTSTKEEADV